MDCKDKLFSREMCIRDSGSTIEVYMRKKIILKSLNNLIGYQEVE